MNSPKDLDPRVVQRETALANRAAGFALLAALLAIIAVVAIPVTFRETDRGSLRALSAAPLAGAVGAVARAYSARRGLETLRSRRGELSSGARAAAGGAEPPQAA